jgi:ketosteroid isomerase-like protein
MKRCPTCNKTFTDRNLSFCVDDGTPLLTAEPPDDEATLVRPSSREDSDSANSSSKPSGSSPDSAEPAAPPYQPPSYVPPGSRSEAKRRTSPLLLGIFVIAILVLGGLGIAAVVLVPRMLRASSNSNTNTSLNTNINRRNSNATLDNRNFNSSQLNANTNSSGADSPPPTDREALLSDLKSLEDEWTVANINADKNKLNHILADDYVGITEGRAQGKAEYLKTIERDTAIQHWEFSNLRVTLNGDRVALTGIVTFDARDENGQDRQRTFKFTDKFVWRDGRWQATSSQVDPVKEPPGVVS